MKICCSQEHYDKVVQYAKSINDKTLENCLERLKQWEKNENRPCEIELYYDHAPYSFGFCERYPDGNTGIVGGLLYHGNRTSPLPSPWNVSTDGAYIPDIYATVCIGEPHAIWGSLFSADMMTASSFLLQNSCFAQLPQGPAGWLSGKIILASLRYFSAKPCRDAGKQTTGTTRNKNACTLQADNV